MIEKMALNIMPKRAAIGADMGCSPDDSEVRAYLAEHIYNKIAQALGYLKYKPRKLNKKN